MRNKVSALKCLIAAVIVGIAAGVPMAVHGQIGGALTTGGTLDKPRLDVGQHVQHELKQKGTVRPGIKYGASSEPVEELNRRVPDGCVNGARPAIVIDDVVNVAAPVAELARRARLPPVFQALQAALTPNPCLELLDNDPLFWTLPGAVQPEVILRVRLSELTVAEQSIGDKAGNAVGRYLGSYLGSHTEEVPQLKQVAIAVDVLCPRSRKKLATVSGQSNEPQPPVPEQNSLRLQAAGQMAAQEIINFFAAHQAVCANASSNSIPSVVSGMN